MRCPRFKGDAVACAYGDSQVYVAWVGSSASPVIELMAEVGVAISD
jgi:hypothetical protein